MTYLLRVYKYNPNHQPAGSPGGKGGQFAPGKGKGKGSNLGEAQKQGYSSKAYFDADGVLHTNNVEDAVKALHEKKKVVLDQPKTVSTLLDKLAAIAQEAAAKGQKAGDYDLCNVSVKGTNLFCAETRGIPRVKMPQLKGVPVKGSKADKLPRDVRGEVDISGEFRKYLESKHTKVEDALERADFLKASQNELNGTKVAGIMKAYQEGKLADERIFVSHDNYVVDGHHRWAAVVGADLSDNQGGKLKVKVARINMPIIQLLAEAKKFANEWGLPQVGK